MANRLETVTGTRFRRPEYRLAAVYAGLVVVPVVLTALLLSHVGPPAVTPTPTATDLGNPLARTLLTVAVLVGVCKLAGLLAPRLGQPPVVAEIATGIALGPSVLGAVWPQGARWLAPPQVLPGVNALAQLGIVLFVFLTGLELDIAQLRGRGPVAIAVGHAGMAVPFLFGVAVAAVGPATFTPRGSNTLAYGLFLGIAMAVTALPVLARVLADTGMQHTEAGVLAMTCAVTTDATAWFLLAVVLAVAGAGTAWGAVGSVLGSVAFAVVLLLVIRPRLAGSAAWARISDKPTAILPLAVIGALLSAMVTDLLGVHAMVGAFLFGVAIPVRPEVRDRLADRIGAVTNTVLLPLFFAIIGLSTKIGALADRGAWAWFAAVLVLAVGSKIGASAIAARTVGRSSRESLEIGVLMNCRGLTELVVLGIGVQLGLLTQQLFTILVLVALVSTAMTTPLIRLLRHRKPDPLGV